MPLSHNELRTLFDQALLALIAVESLYVYFLDYNVLFGCLRLLQLFVLVLLASIPLTLRGALAVVVSLDLCVALSHLLDRTPAPLFLHFVEPARPASRAALLLGDAFLCALHMLVFAKPSLHLA